ncbi:hypothetical protein ACEPPN_008804 [Leptodophora sp. 'Broadleaf-Isolate-01']
MADEQPNYPDSKETTDIGEPPNSKPGAKRRASRAGTRSVASLTPEQLARKRANDREAQNNGFEIYHKIKMPETLNKFKGEMQSLKRN